MIQVSQRSQFANMLKTGLNGFDATTAEGDAITLAGVGRTLHTWNESDDHYVYYCASVVLRDGSVLPLVYHVRIKTRNVPEKIDILATAKRDAGTDVIMDACTHFSKTLRDALTDTAFARIGMLIFAAGDKVKLIGTGNAPAGEGYTVMGRARVDKSDPWTIYVKKASTSYAVYNADRLINTQRVPPVGTTLDDRLRVLSYSKLFSDYSMTRPVPMEYMAALFGIFEDTINGDKVGDGGEGGDNEPLTPPSTATPGAEEVVPGPTEPTALESRKRGRGRYSGYRTANNGSGTGTTKPIQSRVSKTNATRKPSSAVQNGDGVHL